MRVVLKKTLTWSWTEIYVRKWKELCEKTSEKLFKKTWDIDQGQDGQMMDGFFIREKFENNYFSHKAGARLANDKQIFEFFTNEKCNENF